jgi:hypothetical protein
MDEDSSRSGTITSRKEHMLQKVFDDEDDVSYFSGANETRLNLSQQPNEERFNSKDNPSYTIYDKNKESSDCQK